MLAPVHDAGAAIVTHGAPATTVEVVRTPEGFADLRLEWNELLSASNSNCIFLTWEWLHTWWSHLAGGRKLAIAAVRSGGELQAVAPLIMKWPRAEFCGCGFAGSDYLDFIVRDGSQAQARIALTSYLRGGRALKLTNLRRQQNFAAEVALSLQADGWRIAEAKTNVCPYIPLLGCDWQRYLATLGPQHRYNLNRRWRQLHREFEVSFEAAQTCEQTRTFLEVLIGQHNQRWRERGGSDAFHRPELVAFHREFTQIALTRGWLRLFVMRLNGQPAASLYGFLHNRVFYFYQSGFDPAFQRYSVGLIAMGLAIKSAIEEGAEEYDFLHGDEAYKSHWTRHRRELGRIELYPPGLLGRGHCAAIALGRRLKGLMK